MALNLGEAMKAIITLPSQPPIYVILVEILEGTNQGARCIMPNGEVEEHFNRNVSFPV